MFERNLWLRIVSYVVTVFLFFIAFSVIEFSDWAKLILIPVALSFLIVLLGSAEQAEMENADRPVTNYVQKYGQYGIFVAPLTIALIIPIAWYFSGFGHSLATVFEEPQHSYWEDWSLCMLIAIVFGIPAIESISLNNRNKSRDLKTPLWKPVGVLMASAFGLVGIKYLCLWLMNYSSENGSATMMLILSMSIMPIGFLYLLYCFYFFMPNKTVHK